MPLLKFYTSPNQLTPEEKQDLAKVLTASYAQFMPAFYVNVIFLEVPNDSFFIGGTPANGEFVRLSIEHIAVNMDKEGEKGMQQAKKYLDFVAEVFRERFEKRGWRWEYNVVDSEWHYWRIQGFNPPPLDSEEIKVWDKEQKGSEWEGKV